MIVAAETMMPGNLSLTERFAQLTRISLAGIVDQ
jgi:hypothetical protein